MTVTCMKSRDTHLKLSTFSSSKQRQEDRSFGFSGINERGHAAHTNDPWLLQGVEAMHMTDIVWDYASAEIRLEEMTVAHQSTHVPADLQ